MSWGSLGEFLAMGGYGPYIWGSYAMAALCILVEVFSLSKSGRKTGT